MQTSKNISDTVMLLCALEICIMFVAAWTNQVHKRHCWTGQRFGSHWGEGGGSLSVWRCPPLQCLEIMFGTCLTQAPGPAGRGKQKLWPILTQRQVERGSSKDNEACGVFLQMKKMRLLSADDCTDRESQIKRVGIVSECREAVTCPNQN